MQKQKQIADPNTGSPGDAFNQPNPPGKRRKKSQSRASPATPDMIPPHMQGNPGFGPMMPQNPFEEQKGFPGNPMRYSPNSMQGGPYPGPAPTMAQMMMQGAGGQMGPSGPGGHGQGGPPMGMGPGPGSFSFPPGQGGLSHRMPVPGEINSTGPPSVGKIYPSNASMVFNPSNPNAPPIYPCGVCHKEVHDNDQAILCESGCNFWFHRACTGLSDPAFLMLTQEVYAEWVCEQCCSMKTIPLVKMKS